VTASVTDPYSVDLSVDSAWSRATDLSDRALAPRRWRAGRAAAGAAVGGLRAVGPRLLHRGRDGAAAHRGTYLAFAGDGAGIRHLRSLARAGLTHVHLLPVFDFATVPDRRADQAVPPCDLAALPPDSERQQACIAEVADRDGYNWGYDPWHYTTPEGRTRPTRPAASGSSGEMVAGLQRGRAAAWCWTWSTTTPWPPAGPVLGARPDRARLLPRLLDDGSLATSTCCANTAPEHLMGQADRRLRGHLGA
jgi:hypothetical protein